MDKWFSVDNYIKFLCDKIRSDVKRGVKQYSIQAFYNDYSEIVRKLILNGEESRAFDDNGMILKDVDVLSINVDSEIRAMLENNQRQMIHNMLSLQMAEANFEREKKEVAMMLETSALKHNADLNELAARMEREEKARHLMTAQSRFEEHENKVKLEAKQEQDKIIGMIESEQLERKKISEAQRLEIREREIEQASKEKNVYAETVAKVVEAISPDLIAAMQSNSNAETLRVVAESMAPLAIARGESVADTVNTLLRGTSIENMLGKIQNNFEE